MKKRILSAMLCGLLVMSGCQGQSEVNKEASLPTQLDSSAEETVNGAETEAQEEESSATVLETKVADLTYGKEEDYDTSIPSDAVTITGNGDSVDISGKGAEAEGGSVTITQAGTYVLSGVFNGQILIDTDQESLVHLVLAGVQITCEDSATIYGAQSDKIVITLQDGTVNQVSDGQTYVYENAEDDEPDAAIFSKDDLTFNGTGSLIVQGNYEDGIRTKDDLFIVSGIYKIDTVKDSIQGKDSVTILDGTFTITAGNDAIKASNDSDTDKGWMIIENGTFTISAEDDAFHAETDLTINGGAIEILSCYEGIEGQNIVINDGIISVRASDDGINAAGGSSDTQMGGFFGGRGNASDTNQTEENQTQDAEICITINGGEIYVNADGDGIDSNDALVINGGTVYVEGPLNNGNGAIDYEYSGVVNGGIVVATGSSGMAMGFDSDSTQCFILYNLSGSQAAGTELTLKDAEGTVLFSKTINKQYSSVVISIPELEADGTYELTCGTETVEITLDGTSYGNGMSGFGGMGGMMPGGFGGGQKGGEGFGNRPQDGQFDGTFDENFDPASGEGFGGMRPENFDENFDPSNGEGFGGRQQGGRGGRRDDGTWNQQGTESESSAQSGQAT
ncbi:MAG: carbohydrate-binding domain-containing protein [Lachnospiraceae bacterium]|nr:carbohydrate-binding domain-containing protein [Lachnospiraceae bacterium]